MNMDSIIDTIKHLYNEKNLSIDSLEKCLTMLEKKHNITDERELYDFEIDFASTMQNFKSEVLDQLLILLSQLTDIEDIKRLYDRLECIQAILAMEFEEE